MNYHYLRLISDRRLGGILVPFRVRDSYGTWFDERTEFATDLHFPQPMFIRHLLEAATWGRAGDFERFEVRSEGLYAEGSAREGVLGDTLLGMIGEAAWSSGVMPHTIQADQRTGYVRRWPIVEGSVLRYNEVSAPRGTTTVQHIRGAMPQLVTEEKDMDELVRSVWTGWRLPLGAHGDGTAPPPVPPSPPPPVLFNPEVVTMPSQAELRALTSAVQEQNQYLRALADVPLRQLPAVAPDPRQGVPETPAASPMRISVASRWDSVSLRGMLYLDMVRKTFGQPTFRQDEEYLRALLDKVNGQLARQDEAEEVGGVEHLRCIDSVAVETWKKRLPNLRANEAMQSTLATFGDELVPTLFNPSVYYHFIMESRVASLFQSFKMPSNPYTRSKVTAGPTFRRVKEATDLSHIILSQTRLPDSQITTGTITWNVIAGIGAFTIASEELFEDAGINVADMFATEYFRTGAQAMDYVILNGDEAESAVNLGHYGADPAGTAYDKILVLNGLWRLAVTNSDTVAHATISADSPATLCALMGSRGIIGRDIQNLVCLIPPNVAYKFDALADYESINDVGAANATLLNGQVGSVKGIPLVVSDEMENREANGRISSTHNDALGWLMVVHRNFFSIGYSREVKTSQMVVEGADMRFIRTTVRFDLQQFEAGGVGGGYNTTV